MSIFNPALRTGLSILLLVGLAGSAAAATVSALYEAQVPATAEDTESRNTAIAAALGKVLVKLTGRDPAPGLAALADQAPGLVQQFRYQRAVSAEGTPDLKLWVSFDKRGLERAIREQGLPLWGDSRPGVLVWLATERGAARELVSADDVLAVAMREAAEDRGLPLQWPLLDLQDQARLTPADLWSDFSDAVAQASERYNQPLVLSGRLRQVADDHWQGRWTLYDKGNAAAFTSTGATGGQAAAAMVHQLTARLASRYVPAVRQEGPGHLLVQVDDVPGVAHFARVLKLFSDLEVVERAWLRRVEGNRLYLGVQARGDRDALAQGLELSASLQRLPDPEPVPVMPAPAVITAPAVTESAVPTVATTEVPAVAGATPPAAAPEVAAAVVPPAPVVDLIYRLVP